MQPLRTRFVAIALTAIVGTTIVGMTSQALGQTPEQFYKGRNFDVVIGYPPGGSNDTFGRLVARHIGKYIPGNPTVVPKNSPGAGSFLAANQMYLTIPKDGASIAIIAPTATLDEKLGTSGVRFKTADFQWIGRVDSLVNIVFTWKTSPVKTFADSLKTEVTLSGTGAGSTVSIYPTVMNNVFSTKYKLVMGYRGSNEAQLAVERGEVEGHSTSWTAVKVAHPTWLQDRQINVLVQFALKRHPDLPDVPTAVELARNDDERRVLTAIMAATEIGTAFFTSPDAPADRVTVLRRAFDATMKDPELLSEAKKLQVGVSPMTGEELQKLVVNVNDLPPALLEKVRAAYTSKLN
jgi:tripartite-type tricarboxylate transporter receptor subunit TctC